MNFLVKCDKMERRCLGLVWLTLLLASLPALAKVSVPIHNISCCSCTASVFVEALFYIFSSSDVDVSVLQTRSDFGVTNVIVLVLRICWLL